MATQSYRWRLLDSREDDNGADWAATMLMLTSDGTGRQVVGLMPVRRREESALLP